MDRIVIVGSSGHARVVADIVRQEGRHELLGLLDRFRRVGEQVLGGPILGREEDLPRLVAEQGVRGIIVAIGDNHVRAGVAAKIRALCPDLAFACAVHPRATLAPDASVGEGTVVMAGVTVNSGSRIGRLCILNTQASLDHDGLMEDGASLAPGVRTGGNCRIGDHAAIGIGAVLLQGVRVGRHAVVGAGSLVLRDIESHVVAYGQPARSVRRREEGEPYF